MSKKSISTPKVFKSYVTKTEKKIKTYQKKSVVARSKKSTSTLLSIFTDFLYFHYNPRLQCSNNMCASVFQHIFTALALQLHCSSDKDNKYMLDIFSLQFVRLQLEMKSNIQSFSLFAYNLSSQTKDSLYLYGRARGPERGPATYDCGPRFFSCSVMKE